MMPERCQAWLSLQSIQIFFGLINACFFKNGLVLGQIERNTMSAYMCSHGSKLVLTLLLEWATERIEYRGYF